LPADIFAFRDATLPLISLPPMLSLAAAPCRYAQRPAEFRHFRQSFRRRRAAIFRRCKRFAPPLPFSPLHFHFDISLLRFSPTFSPISPPITPLFTMSFLRCRLPMIALLSCHAALRQRRHAREAPDRCRQLPCRRHFATPALPLSFATR
jgi:hypothetical protein